MLWNSCVGINAERGLGLCAFERCQEGHPALADPGLRDGEVACLTPLTDGRPAEYGWFTYRDACVAYRDHYPEAFDCLGVDWSPI